MAHVPEVVLVFFIFLVTGESFGLAYLFIGGLRRRVPFIDNILGLLASIPAPLLYGVSLILNPPTAHSSATFWIDYGLCGALLAQSICAFILVKRLLVQFDHVNGEGFQTPKYITLLIEESQQVPQVMAFVVGAIWLGLLSLITMMGIMAILLSNPKPGDILRMYLTVACGLVYLGVGIWGWFAVKRSVPPVLRTGRTDRRFPSSWLD